ncbi:adenylate kinase 9-like [Styela clava]
MESSIPQHGRTILGDNFNEDETELQFLKSKPTCFIVLGKPGCGKTTISQRLAQMWRCELVHGTEMIQNEMEMSTEVGKKMHELLLKGEALSSEFVMQLIREKILSPEVQHHGYVLDGVPCQDEDVMSVQDQIKMVKGWKLKPDFIINIKIPDMDLNERRVGLRVDPITGDLYCREQWDPDRAPKPPKSPSLGEEEGEIDEEEEEITDETEEVTVTEFFEVDVETKERLVKFPENLPEYVTQHTEMFKDLALKPLEEYMADHDQQYLIELDGNLTPNMLFQQLVNKLDTYVLRRAAVPMRLQNPDEEELPDEIETEELLRTLAAYQMPAPRYRWRRSKWGRICPVALKEGSILQGKPDLAVSFLDKMYIMSSPEAMTKFLKNPRPYLLPPLPKPPCKISVLGFPVSGKTSLCKVLADRYEAVVLDVNELMKDKFAEARKELVDKARQDALESAINLVQNKLEQEATERADARRKEEMEREAAAVAEKEGEAEDGEKEEGEEPPSGGETSATAVEESTEETITSDAREASPVPTVTEEHPEVLKIVSEAVSKAEEEEIKLPADIFVAVLKETIDRIIAERLEADPDAAKDGGWILDNFPTSKEQWGAMAEASLLPDEVICLTDKSPNNELLRKRYYEQNKDAVTEKFRDRLIREKKKLLEEEEEIHHQREALEQEEGAEKSGGETATEEGGTIATEEEPAEEGDEHTTITSQAETAKTETSIRVKLQQEIEELKSTYIGIPSGDAPEFNEFRESLQNFEKEWASLQNSIGGVASTRPLVVNVQEKEIDNIAAEARERIESPFGYQGWDFSGMDVDEEEEDNNADADVGVEGEQEEEDEEALRHKRKHFGFAKHYDPVALKDDFVLWPGNPDIAAKYREKIYYFKSPENRTRFVSKPMDFLPTKEPLGPPPPRVLMLGARGAGKTMHGRWLAEKLGIFHISFRERLQELILPKTGRKMGPEHEEDHLLAKEFLVTVEEAVKKAIEEDPNAEAPAEEEEKFDLDDEQEVIRANLVDDEPLPVEILEKIVPQWFREEPYKSTGFILEGFPRTPEESQFLSQSGLFPDAAVLLMVEDTDVVDRLLPPRMEKWIKRRDHKNAKKNKIKETKTKIRNDKIEVRRRELMNEREATRAAKIAEKLENATEGEEEGEVEEDEEEEDIEEILAQEFEEEEEGEEEEEEQEEDARDRMRGEFGEKFDDDVTKLQTVQEQLEESMIPRIEVQASKKPRIVRYLLDQKMKPLVENRSSLFEKVFPVSFELASKMLLTGYKHPSSFGRWDPVKLKDDNDVVQPISTPISPLFPVIYHHHIYFLSSLNSRTKFMADPLAYVLHQPPAKPVVPIRLAVIGPPKSGKTTLANRFARECGAMRISAGEAIRHVLTKQPKSSLAIHINSHLYQGAVVPDALTAEAIATVMLDTTCTTRGYVLDGFPCTKQQVELLHKKCIVPVRIIELKIEGSEVVKRAASDRLSAERIFPLHDSEEAFVIKLAAFEENVGGVRDWYKTQHQNWVEIDGKLSKWRLWEVALNDSKDSIRKIQNYLDRIARGEAARLNDLCITPPEFHARLSQYGEYCPVALNKRGELVDCSVTPSLELAAEFRSRYYKIGSKMDLDEFLANPEQYVPPLATCELPPPELLPHRRTRAEVKSMFPKQVELKGYCPVSFLDGKLRYEALIEGNPELVVEYRDKLFVFETEEKLQKFMRLPEKYFDLKLPHKLPPKKQPMDITSLPMLGYLEQGAATSIIKALTSVGCFKPKFPFISVTRSCLLFVAYHLKAYNPKASPYVRKKYKQKLENFQQSCELITYLGSNMTKRYRDPAERPIDFDHKMGQFLSLQNSVPIEGWAK